MSKQKVQNYLHELIKNLTQTEKRYFKLLAKQQTPGKKNDYILLFEAIDKQDEFDEEKIKAKFKGTSIEKRYPSLKKYLYELVIKSLTFYNSDTISSVKVRRMMDGAEILQRKGLYHQAIRKLKKAEVMADEVGMYFILNDIRRLMISCQSMMGELPSENDFEVFKQKQNENIEALAETNEIFNKSLDTVFYSMYAFDNTGFDKNQYKDLISEDFKSIEEKIKNNYNKHLFYSTLKRYHSVLNEKNNAREYNEKHIKLFEQELLNKKHLPSNYVHALMGKIETLSLEEDYEEIKIIINDCKEFLNDSTTSYYNRNNDYAHLLCLEQNIALQNGNIKEINKVGKVVSEYVENSRNKINVFANKWLIYNLAWTEILNHNFKKALGYSNDLLNNHQFSSSTYLYTPSIIQNIAIHIELKNFGYLEFAIKSFQKELRKHCNFNELESIIFEFLLKHLEDLDGSRIKQMILFEKLENDYQKSLNDNKDFSTILLLNWVKSKSGTLEIEELLAKAI